MTKKVKKYWLHLTGKKPSTRRWTVAKTYDDGSVAIASKKRFRKQSSAIKLRKKLEGRL